MIRAESSLFALMARWAKTARGPQAKESALVAFPAMFVDLTITASDVLEGSGAGVGNGIAGATIAAGEVVYEDAADSAKLKLADANTSSATAAVKGIAINSAAAGQRVSYVKSGPTTLGAVLTVGKVYVLSATAGKIAPVADLASGWRTSILGVAKSTTSLDVQINNSDTAN